MKKSIHCFTLLMLLMMLVSLSVPALAAETLVITNQPQNLTYPEGSVAIYSVNAAGENLQYKWFISFDGKTYDTAKMYEENQPWEEYAGEAYGLSPSGKEFYFQGIGAGLSGAQIYCDITDGKATVKSSVAYITVSAAGTGMPPEITVPAFMGVDQNAALDLYCSAKSSTGGTLSYLWYETATGKLEDITAIDRGSEITDTLHCDTSNTGTRYYVCMVTDSKGGTGYSSAISVTVSAANTDGTTVTEEKPSDSVSESQTKPDASKPSSEPEPSQSYKDANETNHSQSGDSSVLWWIIPVIVVVAAGGGITATVVIKKNTKN